jgi:hypothetical protein
MVNCVLLRAEIIIASNITMLLTHFSITLGKDEMKRLLITFAGFLVLGILLPCIILAEEKQEKILTGAITLVQAKQTVL